MSFVKDTFFGGAEKKAAEAQTRAIEQSQDFTREGVNQARSDILRLFPQAQRDTKAGFQGALDVFGQSLPQQVNAFTGGNVAAQQALLAGLPQQQAAILGGQSALQPLDIQPFQFQPDMSFAQQQLPSFAQEPTVPQTAQTAQRNVNLGGLNNLFGVDFSNLLGGLNNRAYR